MRQRLVAGIGSEYRQYVTDQDHKVGIDGGAFLIFAWRPSQVAERPKQPDRAAGFRHRQRLGAGRADEADRHLMNNAPTGRRDLHRPPSRVAEIDVDRIAVQRCAHRHCVRALCIAPWRQWVRPLLVGRRNCRRSQSAGNIDGGAIHEMPGHEPDAFPGVRRWSFRQRHRCRARPYRNRVTQYHGISSAIWFGIDATHGRTEKTVFQSAVSAIKQFLEL